ncbi:DUF1508 domain-containing protein [Janthinobacterium sp. AD80]|uniref:DUF1508 domain-containing protein n=1 Tax=Janthinobacterium sp. AD80 TaxID=1528773 RepID=UPI000C864205|nr:DUF1508 domain-containing protein [Janthinobacterium sp. AD80]
MHFEIFREHVSLLGSAREFYVRLVHDGRPLATTGDGYVSKESAQHAIDLVVATVDKTPVLRGLLQSAEQKYDQSGLRFEIYVTPGSGTTLLSMGQFTYRWLLISRNGNKIIHGNKAYFDEASCLHEIALVKSTTTFTRVTEVKGLNSLANLAI